MSGLLELTAASVILVPKAATGGLKSGVPEVLPVGVISDAEAAAGINPGMPGTAAAGVISDAEAAA